MSQIRRTRGVGGQGSGVRNRAGGDRSPSTGPKGGSRGSGSRPPTPDLRHPALRPGQKLTLSFRSLNLDGAGVAVAGPLRVAGPVALPGGEAIVEITRGGGRPQGKIVSLGRKSPRAPTPPCRPLGGCGGCQWEHLSYD